MYISRTMVLVETEDARDADALHRDLLDLRDVLLPLLGGWCASIRSVEDRANLIAGKDRIGLVLVDIEHTVFVVYRAQNEAYKIEKTKKWEKSMNDRELER